MKVEKEIPWDGVERRKKERRCEVLIKCMTCDVLFPEKGGMNMCPDCINKIILHYKKNYFLDIKI